MRKQVYYIIHFYATYNAYINMARLVDHEETWIYNKWEWMVLGVLGCINNADLY